LDVAAAVPLSRGSPPCPFGVLAAISALDRFHLGRKGLDVDVFSVPEDMEGGH
jgi:hypothetical protein